MLKKIKDKIGEIREENQRRNEERARIEKERVEEAARVERDRIQQEKDLLMNLSEKELIGLNHKFCGMADSLHKSYG